ncbi:MAG: AAA family ATPase [Flavobacteriales bacterium]
MLQKLTISNYALITKTVIDFKKEFTVITGETGAGKSIIFGAIELLIGARSTNKILKDPNSKCIVEGIFSLNEQVLEQLVKMDLDIEEDLIIRREIRKNGSSRSFINDSPVKLDQLKHISQYIIEINGQHLINKMGSLNFKYDFIDSFLDDKTTLVNYKNAFLKYSKSLERQKIIVKKVDVLNEKKDFLKFQLDELSNYDFQNWDEEAIQNDYKIAANQDEINDILEKINNIYSSNNGLRDLLGDLNSQAIDLKTNLQDFTSISDRIDSIKIELEDVFHEIHQNFSNLSTDKKNLHELDQQLRQINFLLKKFNVADLKSLILKRDIFKKELSELSEMDLELKEVNNLVESNKKLCLETGNKLFKLRSLNISTIEKKINKVLKTLSMGHANFKIELIENSSITEYGTDQIYLLISVNNNPKFSPLHQFSSGGELSRIALAMKYISSSFNKISTLIFDEIDSGISGKVASEVGSLLQEISTSSQVINITHLPQVAAIAKHHLNVNKKIIAGEMESSISYLSKNDRIQVLAKMLGGDKTGEAALNNALELLN